MRELDSKTFCAAPFAHMYVHKNEDIKMCCISKEYKMASPSTEIDLEKRWKSDYYKNIRQQFLDGEEPSICTSCFTTERNNGRSDRMNFNDRYEFLEPNVETGNQYGSPIDLDIRPGNLCNLKCRMCGPESSSQLEKERIQYTELFGNYSSKVYQPAGVFSEKNIDFLLKNADKGDHIKFLGGEPTIMPEVSDMLDNLIENGKSHINVMITTNCTNSIKSFTDKLNKFSHLSFNYSVDGTGNVVEYIRHPVNFKTIEKNIKLYHKMTTGVDNISFAFQAYNLFNLYDTIKWAADLGVRVRPELVEYPQWCSVLSIPKKIRDFELNRTKQLMLADEKYAEWIIHPLSNIIPTIDRILEDDREYPVKNLAEMTKNFDIARTQHIKDFIPEVWKIVKEEYDAI
jgi:MoaA/NifB/PqqE/SkfB family radical SAM enzyme